MLKISNNYLKEKYNNLIKTEMYKEFIKQNNDYILSSVFIVAEKGNFLDEQIGFYSLSVDKVVSFDLLKHKMSEPENAMKKSGKIPTFKIEEIGVDINEVLKICKILTDKEYSQHGLTKHICILQVLKGILTWNITVVTNTLHMINIRVNAVNSEILNHSAQSIMSLAKKD